MTQPFVVEKTAYSIVDFLEWRREGRLDLNPPYQRRPVWSPRLKSKLIDSLLRGYPIPLIFLHNRIDVESSRNVRQVVDGQQRLRTILSFIDLDSLDQADDWDEFTVMRSHNEEYGGLAFSQYPSEVRERILQTPLSVNVLPGDVDDATLLQIFQRMNSTGLKLNAQELRNADWYGEFKDMSYALAYEQFQRWLTWRLFDRQKIGQMYEVEFTSDLLGLLLEGVLPRTKSTIDRLYRDYDDGVPDPDALATAFREGLDFLDSVYGVGETRSPLKRFRSPAWVYACFAVATRSDALTLTGELRNPGGRPPKNVENPAEMIDILEAAESSLRGGDMPAETLKRLRGATSDKTSRQSRIDFLRSLS